MIKNNKILKFYLNKQSNIKYIENNSLKDITEKNSLKDITEKNSLKDITEKNINIPKILHICYKNKNIPDYIIPNWQKFNPNHKIFFYDDNDCINFLKDNYNQVYVDIFNFIKDGPIKADFFRVCVLYKLGGIYCDIDIEPLISFDEFIEKDISFLTCLSQNKNELNPHIIICDKNNNLIKSCIDTYIHYYNNKKTYSYWEWSIVHILDKILFKNLNKIITESGIYYDNEKNKYQFIKEVNYKYCVYNNKKILNNRYNSYDSKNHTF